MLHGQKYLKDGLVKAAVFGANDGIITTFAIVAGVSGANMPIQVILVLGVANMIADGISMGLGDFLGERSERRFQISQNRHNTHLSKLGLSSLITFVSFVLAGSLPLIPYFANLAFRLPMDNSFLLSILSTTLALFVIGSLRTIFTKGAWWKNGLEMLFVGALAAFASYFLGSTVQMLIQ